MDKAAVCNMQIRIYKHLNDLILKARLGETIKLA